MGSLEITIHYLNLIVIVIQNLNQIRQFENNTLIEVIQKK